MAYHLHVGDACDAYPQWPTPDLIVSDGAYGVEGFEGDPDTAAALPDWYRPHVEAWSRAAEPHTMLFFWNTEVGWATTHPVLVENGWEYVQLITWDKGVAHVAGNVNSETIRSFPVVTEVCAVYRRPATVVRADGGVATAQEWLRSEWARTGLPLRRTNEACGVKDAATRKYFTTDAHWYFPPADAFERLVAYANEHGDPAGRPYFAADGRPLTGGSWTRLRAQWNHVHGLTNVWRVPALRSKERIKTFANGRGIGQAIHTNQKPLELMRRCIRAVGGPGSVVWEPFGGLGSASVAAAQMGRIPYLAEQNPVFAQIAAERLDLEETATLFKVS